ncbi:MAG: hypothetical protein M1269_07860 [Chloroflexi bacterium]|nr:hypothetical protein [Chloroflexota bacterium]
MKEIFKTILILLIVILGCQALPALGGEEQQAPPEDNLIVPGERIGPLKLGSKPEQIEALLGKPTTVAQNPVEKKIQWEYGKNSDFFIQFDKSGADMIFTTIDVYSTKDGIKPGTDFRVVILQFGSNYKFQNFARQEMRYVAFEKDGIGFLVQKDTIKSIFVFPVKHK